MRMGLAHRAAPAGLSACVAEDPPRFGVVRVFAQELVEQPEGLVLLAGGGLGPGQFEQPLGLLLPQIAELRMPLCDARGGVCGRPGRILGRRQEEVMPARIAHCTGVSATIVAYISCAPILHAGENIFF